MIFLLTQCFCFVIMLNHYVKKVSLLENKEEVGDTDRIVTIRFSNLWEMKWHKKS